MIYEKEYYEFIIKIVIRPDCDKPNEVIEAVIRAFKGQMLTLGNGFYGTDDQAVGLEAAKNLQECEIIQANAVELLWCVGQDRDPLNGFDHYIVKDLKNK